ncbi:hypothetical protein NCCP2495_20740 [Dietzia sp. NCCP-2495]|uniref:hypothetical protein n=1 Tax=Dietzia sp. NCCP-2495 TaxID=2934675 RepID=UPI00223051F7|nr:hypothetical protein [Dietzia sp. NCCP-2495]GLB64195.1 hypothetical protein NCCP2495_20740 [Dietzia sp. NCCP-2495]
MWCRESRRAGQHRHAGSAQPRYQGLAQPRCHGAAVAEWASVTKRDLYQAVLDSRAADD